MEAERRGQNRVALDGEWDLNRRDELISVLATLRKDGAVTIDVRGLTFADSTFLNVLAVFRERLAGVPIILVGVQPNILRLLKIVQFDRLFDIRTSVDWDGLVLNSRHRQREKS